MPEEKFVHETHEGQLGTVEVFKSNKPLAYQLRFRPFNAKHAHILEIGELEMAADTGAIEPKPLEETDFLQSFRLAGAPFDFVCQNSAQQQIMDALKVLSTGADYRYVIQCLKGIPK